MSARAYIQDGSNIITLATLPGGLQPSGTANAFCCCPPPGCCDGYVFTGDAIHIVVSGFTIGPCANVGDGTSLSFSSLLGVNGAFTGIQTSPGVYRFFVVGSYTFTHYDNEDCMGSVIGGGTQDISLIGTCNVTSFSVGFTWSALSGSGAAASGGCPATIFTAIPTGPAPFMTGGTLTISRV